MPDIEKTSPVPVELPQIAWIGGHPTMFDPEAGAVRPRLRRCVRCDARSTFDAVRCDAGLIVHLIDPDDIHAAPEAFDGSPWAEPRAMEGAARHWADQGFVVTRKPDGPTGEHTHPRFRPCPACNQAEMAAGRMPVRLPAVVPPRQYRAAPSC
jgi:hypothetical protein